MVEEVTLVLALLTACCGAAGASVDAELEPAERQLVEVAADLDAAYKALWAEAEQIEEPAAQRSFSFQNSPAHKYFPKLLSLEEKHRGSAVGLMALRQIEHWAARSGHPDDPRYHARGEALERLVYYETLHVTADLFRSSGGGAFNPAVGAALRQLGNSPSATVEVRQTAQLALARWLLQWADNRAATVMRLEELGQGAPERYAGERALLEDFFARVSDEDVAAQWRVEAVKILGELAAAPEQVRQPAVAPVDENYVIVRLDSEKTQLKPIVSDLAEGVLFRELHLAVGRPAPVIELGLVDGEPWSLAAQRGKVVVVQFSFKGCGPCEAMYPMLRAMHAQHPDRLEILSIMADERPEVSAEAVEAGKMTWSVAWDGRGGPIATRWGVQTFPAVYVIDQAGIVAAVHVTGPALQAVVDQLLKQQARQ